MSRAAYLAAADAIGARLCRDAIWAGRRCNWLGWGAVQVPGTSDSWVSAFQAASSDLYEGTSGIGLFLARLYRFNRDKRCRRSIEGAAQQALSRMPQIKPAFRLGFFSGSTGIAYALAEMGRILEHEGLVRRALDELRAVRKLALDVSMTDVINGCAGTIPALLDIGIRFACDDLLDLAVEHGEHLLRLAVPSDRGQSWDTMGIARQGHLLGFAHGAAGIVTALLELYRYTGEARWLHAAQQGLRYERSHFDASTGNWPDLRIRSREANGRPGFLTAWCHGAPGIGLSRVRCLELLPRDEAILRDIEAAIAATLPTIAQPPPDRRATHSWEQDYRNFSLCHGMCGNAELMLAAADVLQREELRSWADQVGDLGIECVERPGRLWPCGTQGRLETANLMTGLAGIGYFYLRLHDVRQVPSILVLAPGNPPTRQRATENHFS